MDQQNQPIEARLTQLWQEGSRDVAIQFLRRAMHAELTLEELAAILQFDAVTAELAHIHLRDIWPPPTQRATPAARAEARPATHAAAAGGAAGMRRSPQQTNAMKQLLHQALQANPDSGCTTPELCDKLQAGGFKADAPTATLVLRTMEIAGEVHSDNGRPKTWRLKSSGTRPSAPSMFIRRSSNAPPTADAPALENTPESATKNFFGNPGRHE